MADRAMYKPRGKIKARPELLELATVLFGVLAQDAEVWEYGSGGSTLWLSGIASKVISIEDDVDWHVPVTKALSDLGRTNTEVRLTTTKAQPDAITGAGLFDIVFVDCLRQESRRRSVILGAKHVKPGCWLIVDDYNFPKPGAEVEKLRKRGWDVTVLSGKKIHPVRNKPVGTSIAFCKRPTS